MFSLYPIHIFQFCQMLACYLDYIYIFLILATGTKFFIKQTEIMIYFDFLSDQELRCLTNEKKQNFSFLRVQTGFSEKSLK